MKLIWQRAGQTTKTFESTDFIGFIVTGFFYNSRKRFCNSYSCSAYHDKTCRQVFMINLWNGSVWGVLPSGKRKLLKRVYN